MSEKIDLIYDSVTRIDTRQRDKELSDAIRHADEQNRMANIEKDLSEHKEGVIQNRSRITVLEESKNFNKKLMSKLTKTIGIVGSLMGLAYTAYRIIG